jgi:ketosteroid isomerase-like protein
MYKSFLIVALLIAAATHAFAQTTKVEQNNSAEQTVLKLTQEWLTAENPPVDRAALNRIIADDFLGTGPRGTTVSKKDVIPREGTAADSHGLSINGQDIKARVFGDTAIVTGRGVPKAQTPEERPEMRFTIVFVRRADSWQMVAGHLSAVPSE